MQVEQKIEIHKWLILAGLEGSGEKELVEGFGRRLCDAGMQLARLSVASNILHPVHQGRGIVWRPDGDIDVSFYEPAAEDMPESEEWLNSPFYRLVVGNDDLLLRNLDDTYLTGEFPMLDEFQAQGISSYMAARIGFGEDGDLGDQRGMVMSVCTRAASGFTGQMIDSLMELFHTFALAYKSMMQVFTGRTLMRTYLGRNAANRVLKGAIRRGSADQVEGVLWYSDLKGFTRIADNVPREQLMPLLNDYAECVAQSIEHQGGEILKFMGDGILAMFPANNPELACENALNAATSAIAASDKLSAERTAKGLPISQLYLGLHRGDVLFGNIGSRERLDFTVIGPAVNELSRIENMCGTLEQRVVISSAFANLSPVSARRLVSLGRYALRGVAKPQELFTIDNETISP